MYVCVKVLNGGVAACSSQDLITWRFEGIVFHYTNLSDQVYGSGQTWYADINLRMYVVYVVYVMYNIYFMHVDGPFYVERPKVLFNSETKNYVMWAVS